MRVAGRVRHPVECRPAGVIVRGPAPQTVYLVGADADPFEAVVIATPGGLTATIEPEPPLAGRAQARLVLTPAAGGRPAGEVRVRVTAGGPPFELEVPVSCPAP